MFRAMAVDSSVLSILLSNSIATGAFGSLVFFYNNNNNIIAHNHTHISTSLHLCLSTSLHLQYIPNAPAYLLPIQ